MALTASVNTVDPSAVGYMALKMVQYAGVDRAVSSCPEKTRSDTVLKFVHLISRHVARVPILHQPALLLVILFADTQIRILLKFH